MVDENEKTVDGFKVLETEEKVEVELDESSNKKSKGNNTLREVVNYIFLVAIAFILAQVIHQFLFTPITVIGESMEPTIIGRTYNTKGDRIFLSRVAKIDRYDIIVFDVPHKPEPYIKRVIGMPGDSVYMDNYKLYINGELVDEYYLDPNPIYTGLEYAHGLTSFTLESLCAKTVGANCFIDGEYRIPEGFYLVLGDNRNNSEDSRSLGLIPKERIIGQAIFVFYPFNRFGISFI